MEESNPQPPAPNPGDLISIGEITAPHGVRGELRVTMLTDFPQRWRALREVYLTPPEAPRRGRPAPGPQRYAVQSARVLGGARTPRRMRLADPADQQYGPWGGQIHQVLLRLVGVDTPEAATAFRGYLVQVPRSAAWPLPAGTYYTFQLLDLPVVTPTGAPVGTVTDILTTGNNDVYVLKTPEGKELLVPAIKEIVEEINPAEGYIRIKDPGEWAPEDDSPPPRRAPRQPR
jgi:16S rRNA processing protein RimM